MLWITSFNYWAKSSFFLKISSDKPALLVLNKFKKEKVEIEKKIITSNNVLPITDKGFIVSLGEMLADAIAMCKYTQSLLLITCKITSRCK